ncbi:hypothetical protein [Bradyrhizobium sp. UASWS1016]|jgi:hypothetical protein|uniref:hypothetical protein n=1 Tax=Bradyrhizobium sp. UASWS1016 TaxID=1566379 RepID=UPI00143CF9A3|nr:hypothetical protein [Bradyrhizobium sp. UASWS1016]
MRKFGRISCIFAGGLAGCSLYPIPDDVSPYSTEEIVHYGRCEVRDAILLHMYNVGITNTIQPAVGEINRLIKDVTDKFKHKKHLSPLEMQMLRLTKVAVVYSFDFNITEDNKAGADAGFRLPWPITNTFDVGATGALDLTRQGQRVFGTGDSWDELLVNTTLCGPGPFQRPGNLAYPLTGSIGVGRAVETFINIDLQGGAKDNFVDTLTFTTQVSGGANAAVKLDPVPNQFRPVSATASVSVSRLDVHKLTISFAFPQLEQAPTAIDGVVRVDGDLNAPFTRPAPWRARYNLCVQDARTRENTFKMLRLEAPEVYCIRYADAFAPQTGLRAKQDVLRVELEGGVPGSPPATGAGPPPAGGGAGGGPPSPSANPPLPPPNRRITPQFVPQVRENAPL